MRYFPISSQLKQYADEGEDSEDIEEDFEESGFTPLTNFVLGDLVKEQQNALVHKALINLEEEIKFHRTKYIDEIENIKKANSSTIREKEKQIRVSIYYNLNILLTKHPY